MNKIVNLENLPNVFEVKGVLKLLRKTTITKRVLNYAIKKYIAEGSLIKLKAGMYSKTSDPFYIAAFMYKGYIGLSSALYLHKLKTETEAGITVCVPKTRKRLHILDKVLIPVNIGNYFYGTSLIQYNDLEVLVSTIPKTIFDMLYRPKYANYYDMYRSLNERQMAESEWKELLYYLKDSNLTTVKRAGYALEFNAPAWFTKRLQRIVDNSKGVSFFLEHKALNYNKKWKIFDDINAKRWRNAI